MNAPVNVLGGPSFTQAELAELGVARISLGTRMVVQAMGEASQAASRALQGDFEALSSDFTYNHIQSLFEE